jgi:hypothetical protein
LPVYYGLAVEDAGGCGVCTGMGVVEAGTGGVPLCGVGEDIDMVLSSNE